jgi:hypothetical protein
MVIGGAAVALGIDHIVIVAPARRPSPAFTDPE